MESGGGTQVPVPMTREDYLEVAVRVLGLYAWLLAALAAVEAVASLPVVAYALMGSPEPHPELTPASGIFGAVAFSTIKCVLLFFAGRYLIRDGRWVLEQVRRWSGTQDPARSDEPPSARAR